MTFALLELDGIVTGLSWERLVFDLTAWHGISCCYESEVAVLFDLEARGLHSICGRIVALDAMVG